MSSQTEKKWIVKDGDGRIFGPFTTAQVISEIDKGSFQGGEQIASYPGGQWISISKAPEFYDRLLDVLAAEVRPVQRSRVATFGKEQVSESNQASDDSAQNSKSQHDESHAAGTSWSMQASADDDEEFEHLTLENSGQTSTRTRGPAEGSGPIIELTDLKSLERKERIKSSRLPLILIGAAVVLILVALFFPTGESSNDNRINLLAPRSGQPEIGMEKVAEKFKRALSSFQMDTYSGYLRAQNELVEAIEGASPKPEYFRHRAEMLSTLCLVYRELWPFSKQGSRDLKVVSIVMQEAKRVDPGGLDGTLCEIVDMTVGGRMREAQGLTESMLVEESQAPVLFEIRGDIYMYVRDYKSAINYFTQARVLWPNWFKLRVQEARARAEDKQYPQAIQLYKEVLSKVPNHSVARIELGLLEAVQFDHYDKGYELLNAALESDERVPRHIEASAYYGIAHIFDRRNQSKKALQYAQKAYALNPGHMVAKELILRLAGEGGLSKTNFESRELIYQGDQYVRAGDCFSAQAQFKAAFEADKENGVAAMKAGKCLWQLNQSEDAIEWMKKAITADPQLISAYTELADYYAQRYDYQSASLVLRKAQRAAPNSYEVYRGFATVELRRNSFQTAADFAEKALKIYETDVTTLLLMAKAQLGLQNYQEAQRYAGKLIELDFNRIEAHVIYGKAQAGIHGISAGADYFLQMINRYVITQGQQIPPAAVELRVALGEIYLKDDHLKAAEELFRQAISLDPDNKNALIHLGKVLKRQGQGSAALEVFLKAAVLDPSDADPIFYSGEVYTEVGKFGEAARQFDRVLKINPRYPRAHTQIGEAYLKLNQPQKALEEAMLERDINPDLSDSYLLAADAHFALRQYSNCAQEYQKAVSKRPQSAMVLVKMARCYRLSGALDSAQSLLRQAQALESGNPDIYKEQGAIYHTKGMADEAVAAYDTYLKLAPNAADRMEVEARMMRVQQGDLTIGE